MIQGTSSAPQEILTHEQFIGSSLKLLFRYLFQKFINYCVNQRCVKFRSDPAVLYNTWTHLSGYAEEV